MNKKKKVHRQKTHKSVAGKVKSKEKDYRGIPFFDNNPQSTQHMENDNVDHGIQSQDIETEGMVNLIFRSAQDMGLVLAQNKEDVIKVIRENLEDSSQEKFIVNE